MSWDFETDPEFQKELDWIDLFVKEEVEPLDHVLGFPYEEHEYFQARSSKKISLLSTPEDTVRAIEICRAHSGRLLSFPFPMPKDRDRSR